MKTKEKLDLNERQKELLSKLEGLKKFVHTDV